MSDSSAGVGEQMQGPGGYKICNHQRKRFAIREASMRVRATLRNALFAAICAAALPATGAYPDRPIRYILPSAAGGGPDVAARIVMAELGRQLGTQIVVDNRPGGSGVIGTEAIARSTPDGYTI